MKISEIKKLLVEMEQIAFELPNGELVPGHFHVTEIGKIHKKFIDCGSTVREEEKAAFQLWEANDYDHRLHPEKLLSIIELSQKILSLGDLEIEIEYQAQTIEKFGLEFNGHNFLLTNKFTDCLAKENCGIPEKPKKRMADMQVLCCAPGNGCC